MGLLTVAELREHVETSLPDTAPGRALLHLRQVPTAVTTVIDLHRSTETTLDPVDYGVEERYLRRLGGRSWGERTNVTYSPFDDSAVRRMVLVQLCQLELNVQPGMAAQGAGPWSETYGKYLRQRDELLRAIRPADPPMPRAVPYSTART